MKENSQQSNKKEYRIVQIEGKISWRVEELWDGGVQRGPYGAKDAAILSEENIARDNGFIDELVLQEVVEEGISHTDAFNKDSDGNWLCNQACSIEMDNKVIIFNEGLTFTKGTPFMGVDVAKWLDENS